MPCAHRGVVAGGVDLLQQPRRDDERGPEHGQVEPPRAAAAPGVPVALDVPRRLHDVSPAADVRERERQDDDEAGQQDDELRDVDPGGRQQAAGAEVDGDDQAAQRASHPAVEPDHHVEHPADRQQLARENGQRADPQQRGDRRADGRAVALLQEVADGVEVVLRGEAPDAGPDPHCQDDRSEPGRPDPPPRAQAVAIAERGGVHGRSGADVRGQDRGEQHERAEPAPGDEEVAREPHAPAGPQAEAHEQGRVDHEHREVEVHGWDAAPVVVGGRLVAGREDRAQEPLHRVRGDLPARPAEDVVAPVRGPGQPHDGVRHAGVEQPRADELRVEGRHVLVPQALDEQRGAAWPGRRTAPARRPGSGRRAWRAVRRGTSPAAPTNRPRPAWRGSRSPSAGRAARTARPPREWPGRPPCVSGQQRDLGAGGAPQQHDPLGVEAVRVGEALHVAQGGREVLLRGRELPAGREPVGDGRHDVAARRQILVQLGQVALVAADPAAAVDRDDHRPCPLGEGRAVEVEREVPAVHDGVGVLVHDHVVRRDPEQQVADHERRRPRRLGRPRVRRDGAERALQQGRQGVVERQGARQRRQEQDDAGAGHERARGVGRRAAAARQQEQRQRGQPVAPFAQQDAGLPD